MDSFVKALLSKDGRAIIVDQMESIFLEQQGRDYTLLTLFRDAIYNLAIGQGKLILISDIRFSTEIFPNHPSVRRIEWDEFRTTGISSASWSMRCVNIT